MFENLSSLVADILCIILFLVMLIVRLVLYPHIKKKHKDSEPANGRFQTIKSLRIIENIFMWILAALIFWGLLDIFTPYHFEIYLTAAEVVLCRIAFVSFYTGLLWTAKLMPIKRFFFSWNEDYIEFKLSIMDVLTNKTVRYNLADIKKIEVRKKEYVIKDGVRRPKIISRLWLGWLGGWRILEKRIEELADKENDDLIRKRK